MHLDAILQEANHAFELNIRLFSSFSGEMDPDHSSGNQGILSDNVKASCPFHTLSLASRSLPATSRRYYALMVPALSFVMLLFALWFRQYL